MDSEIATLKASEQALKEQVKNLKKSATESPDLNPDKEQLDGAIDDVDKLLEYASTHDDFQGITENAEKLGLFD